MATFYRCDGCGRELSNKGDLRVITLPYMNQWGNDFTEERDGYDKEVCVSCANKLTNAFKNLKDK